MKYKRRFLLLTVLFALSCSACEDAAPTEATQPAATVSTQAEVIQQTAVPGNENPANAGDLLEIGTVSGTVVEFSDRECKLTPTQYEENMAYEPAPGYETELITVAFEEGYTVQFANVNVRTGSVTYAPAGIGDIGEQVSLVVCGEYDSDGILQGKRIFLYRSVW